MEGKLAQSVAGCSAVGSLEGLRLLLILKLLSLLGVRIVLNLHLLFDVSLIIRGELQPIECLRQYNRKQVLEVAILIVLDQIDDDVGPAFLELY